MLIFFGGHMVIQLVERGGQDIFFFFPGCTCLDGEFFSRQALTGAEDERPRAACPLSSKQAILHSWWDSLEGIRGFVGKKGVKNAHGWFTSSPKKFTPKRKRRVPWTETPNFLGFQAFFCYQSLISGLTGQTWYWCRISVFISLFGDLFDKRSSVLW